MTQIDMKIESLCTQFKELGSPCSDKDIENLIESLKEYGIEQPRIPTELRMLWETSLEWHLIEDHYQVFGFNLFSPQNIINITFDIFGDEDGRKEWREESLDSCSQLKWVCIGSYSEYDYIFVDLDQSSPSFGSTRHIVNNCNEETPLTSPPFSNFIDYMLTFVDGYNDE